MQLHFYYRRKEWKTYKSYKSFQNHYFAIISHFRNVQLLWHIFIFHTCNRFCSFDSFAMQQLTNSPTQFTWQAIKADFKQNKFVALQFNSKWNCQRNDNWKRFFFSFFFFVGVASDANSEMKSTTNQNCNKSKCQKRQGVKASTLQIIFSFARDKHAPTSHTHTHARTERRRRLHVCARNWEKVARRHTHHQPPTSTSAPACKHSTCAAKTCRRCQLPLLA